MQQAVTINENADERHTRRYAGTNGREIQIKGRCVRGARSGLDFTWPLEQDFFVPLVGCVVLVLWVADCSDGSPARPPPSLGWFYLRSPGSGCARPPARRPPPEIRTGACFSWGADAEGGAPSSILIPSTSTASSALNMSWRKPMAQKIGVQATLVQNQWDQLMPALDRGGFDIILNGLELTPENQQHIAMSLPYFVYAQQIVARKDAMGLGLVGKVIGGRQCRRVVRRRYHGTLLDKRGAIVCEKLIRETSKRCGIKGRPDRSRVIDLPIAQLLCKARYLYAEDSPESRLRHGLLRSRRAQAGHELGDSINGPCEALVRTMAPREDLSEIQASGTNGRCC